MFGRSLELYQQNFRIFAGTAVMVTMLQALELLYVPSAISLFVFIAFWPMIVGVLSQAISSAYLGQPATAIHTIYESIGWKRFVVLSAANAIIIVAVALGLLLFIAPGIYLLVRFQFAPQAIVLERRRLLDAFKRSSDLVRDNWWRVFRTTLSVYGAATLVNLITVAVVTIASSVVGLSDAVSGVALLAGISIVWALMDPVVFGVLLMLFYDLSRKANAANPG